MRRGFFTCSNIPRHLGEGATEITKYPGQVIARPNQPIRKYNARMCLVCGDEVFSQHIGSWKCIDECNIMAHETCIRVLCRAADLEVPNRDEYKCDFISYQFKPEEITRCISMEGSNVDYCNNVWLSYCGDHTVFNSDGIKKLKIIMKQRGKISSMGYFNKMKRYSNDLIQCKQCSIWYGLDETDHLAKFCSGITSDPIVRENEMYPLAKIRRYCADRLPD